MNGQTVENFKKVMSTLKSEDAAVINEYINQRVAELESALKETRKPTEDQRKAMEARARRDAMYGSADAAAIREGRYNSGGYDLD